MVIKKKKKKIDVTVERAVVCTTPAIGTKHIGIRSITVKTV